MICFQIAGAQMLINNVSRKINFCAYKSKFSEHLEERLASKPDFKEDALLTNEFRDILQNHYSKDLLYGCRSF